MALWFTTVSNSIIYILFLDCKCECYDDCRAQRLLRCVSCTSFYNVLLAWSMIGSERACVATTLEKPSVSAYKTIPGNFRASQNRARAAQLKRKIALAVPPGPPKVYINRLERAIWSEEARIRAPDERTEPRIPRAVISESLNGHLNLDDRLD